MSIQKIGEQKWKIRWREDGRLRSLTVSGPHALARKIERKKLSVRDENRHLDVKKEFRVRMSALIDRYEAEYASKKRSYNRERAVLNGLRQTFGSVFVHEVDGGAVQRWYHGLTATKGLSSGTALRHFNVLHHLLGRAKSIWGNETGLTRNPADDIEVERPKDGRDRFLSESEISALKKALDHAAFDSAHPAGAVGEQRRRMRLVVLIALTTGMRESEIFGLEWSDLDYSQHLIAVRSKLKGGGMRYVPMSKELAGELTESRIIIS